VSISQEELKGRENRGAKIRSIKSAPTQKPQQVEVNLTAETQVVEVEVEVKSTPQEVEIKLTDEGKLQGLISQVAELTRIVGRLIEDREQDTRAFEMDVIYDARGKITGVKGARSDP